MAANNRPQIKGEAKKNVYFAEKNLYQKNMKAIEIFKEDYIAIKSVLILTGLKKEKKTY